jgi:hypothetical protein
VNLRRALRYGAIVVALVGAAAVALVAATTTRFGPHGVSDTVTTMTRVQTLIMTYELRHRCVPTAIAEIDDGTLGTRADADGWGRPMMLLVEPAAGSGSYALVSLGADGVAGGTDGGEDIVQWGRTIFGGPCTSNTPGPPGPPGPAPGPSRSADDDGCACIPGGLPNLPDVIPPRRSGEIDGVDHPETESLLPHEEGWEEVREVCTRSGIGRETWMFCGTWGMDVGQGGQGGQGAVPRVSAWSSSAAGSSQHLPSPGHHGCDTHRSWIVATRSS